MGVRELATLMLTPVELGIDFLRMMRWSKAAPFCPQHLRTRYEILLLAHTVEKGMSSRSPRPGFGGAKIKKLLYWIEKHDATLDPFPIEKSFGALNAYLEWNAEVGHDLGELGAQISAFIVECISKEISPRGGIKRVAVSESFSWRNPEEFLLTRFSSRRFSEVVISEDIINRISEIARRAPSQCNRQSVRVHYFSAPGQIDALLRLQGGAEEFRPTVRNLFVVSSVISAWSGHKARNQAFVDGALLAMQVLNACQALGLVSCPLNLAVSNSREGEIRRVGRIGPEERLIVMIAFGHPLSGDVIAARSERLSGTEILVRHVD